MTETVTKVSITELNVARVTCKKCFATVEVPIANLHKTLSGQACAHCNATLLDDSEKGRLVELKNAIGAVKQLEMIEVQFVIKENLD